MTFTAGIDYICIISEVRRLARNVLPADFSDAQIESYAYKAYSLIQTFTNKKDWDSDDVEYGVLQGFNTDIAAEWIKSHYGPTDEFRAYAKTRMNDTIAMLNEVIKNMDTSTGEEAFTIARTARKSWNLNPAVEVPRGNLTIS